MFDHDNDQRDQDARTTHEDHEMDSPTYGDDQLSSRLFYLFMLMRRSDASLRHGRRRAGGFRGQGRVLRLLALHSPIAQSELAYLLGIRSQSLAELLGKLEEDGLIERTPHEEDRRTKMVDLTERGRELTADEEAETPTDPFAVLTEEEQRTLAHLLDRVIQDLEENLPEGPDRRMKMFKEMAFAPGGDPSGMDFEGFRGRPGGFGPGFGPGRGRGHRSRRRGGGQPR